MRKNWQDLPAFSLPAAAMAAASEPLGIAGLRGWRLREPSSGRRYTVVRLETRSGLAGYGEGGPVKGSDISEARPLVLGKAATDLELVRLQLAGSPAIEAAVNNALLDILGKSTKLSIYQFLGGPTRFKARVLAQLEGEDEQTLADSLHRALDAGFLAFSVPLPARPPMIRTQAYVDMVRQRLERLQSAGGADADFVLDAGGSLTPGDAAAIATSIERLHPMWFDEPTEVLTNDALAKITDESVLPVGLGRGIHDVASFQNLLRGHAIDVLRPSLALNSLVKIRRMAAVAEAEYVAIAPHHAGGPIATVAGIHLAASLPNFFIQQVPLPAAAEDRAMRAELTSGNHESADAGYAPLLNRPGLGIEVNEQALTKYSEEVL
jgi:galactonate dehydratase